MDHSRLNPNAGKMRPGQWNQRNNRNRRRSQPLEPSSRGYNSPSAPYPGYQPPPAPSVQPAGYPAAAPQPNPPRPDSDTCIRVMTIEWLKDDIMRRVERGESTVLRKEDFLAVINILTNECPDTFERLNNILSTRGQELDTQLASGHGQVIHEVMNLARSQITNEVATQVQTNAAASTPLKSFERLERLVLQHSNYIKTLSGVNSIDDLLQGVAGLSVSNTGVPIPGPPKSVGDLYNRLAALDNDVDQRFLMLMQHTATLLEEITNHTESLATIQGELKAELNAHKAELKKLGDAQKQKSEKLEAVDKEHAEAIKAINTFADTHRNDTKAVASLAEERLRDYTKLKKDFEKLTHDHENMEKTLTSKIDELQKQLRSIMGDKPKEEDETKDEAGAQKSSAPS